MKVLMMCSIGALLMVVTYLIVQGMRCSIATRNKRKQLSDYNAKYIYLSYGTMSYVDEGSGEVILSVHGIFGGYDRAFDTCKDFVSEYRILAPSNRGFDFKASARISTGFDGKCFHILTGKVFKSKGSAGGDLCDIARIFVSIPAFLCHLWIVIVTYVYAFFFGKHIADNVGGIFFQIVHRSRPADIIIQTESMPVKLIV